jgi:hypothetical protein
MTTESASPVTVRPEVAYYYPEWHWRPDEHGWIKSLLLFFDEIALLVPDYKRFEPANLDPPLAGVLQDEGLHRIIEPEQFVDAEMTTALAETMVTIIEGGAFDHLSRSDDFTELSMSRAGYVGERESPRRLSACSATVSLPGRRLMVFRFRCIPRFARPTSSCSRSWRDVAASDGVGSASGDEPPRGPRCLDSHARACANAHARAHR